MSNTPVIKDPSHRTMELGDDIQLQRRGRHGIVEKITGEVLEITARAGMSAVWVRLRLAHDISTEGPQGTRLHKRAGDVMELSLPGQWQADGSYMAAERFEDVDHAGTSLMLVLTDKSPEGRLATLIRKTMPAMGWVLTPAPVIHGTGLVTKSIMTIVGLKDATLHLAPFDDQGHRLKGT